MKGKVRANIERDVRFSYEINNSFSIEATIRNSGVPSIHIRDEKGINHASWGENLGLKEMEISELISGLQELLMFLDMNTHKE